MMKVCGGCGDIFCSFFVSSFPSQIGKIMARAAAEEGGGSEKVELGVQVIFHSVQDNHRVVRAREQPTHIFFEIKVKTTQRKVEIQFQKHSQLPETY